jgi:5-methylcytosine-specific restriction endonuclease McrA
MTFTNQHAAASSSPSALPTHAFPSAQHGEGGLTAAGRSLSALISRLRSEWNDGVEWCRVLDAVHAIVALAIMAFLLTDPLATRAMRREIAAETQVREWRKARLWMATAEVAQRSPLPVVRCSVRTRDGVCVQSNAGGQR